jgi:hypothetical protein
MRRPVRVLLVPLVLLGLSALPVLADDALELNPFNDPFLVATQGGSPCPAPMGPAYTRAQVLEQSHHRAERGTTCWLAGQCAEPNAYRNDPMVATAVVRALRAEPALAGTRIWVTVQRAFVTLEGCVSRQAQARLAEEAAKRIDGVQLVLPALAVAGAAPPYRVAAPR